MNQPVYSNEYGMWMLPLAASAAQAAQPPFNPGDLAGTSVGFINPSDTGPGLSAVPASEMFLMGAQNWARAGAIDIQEVTPEEVLAGIDPNWVYVAPTFTEVKWSYSPVGTVPWSILTCGAERYEYTFNGETVTLDNYIGPAPLNGLQVVGGNTDGVTGQSDLGFDCSAIDPLTGGRDGLLIHNISLNNPLKVQAQIFPSTTALTILRPSLVVVIPPVQLEQVLADLYGKMQNYRLREITPARR